VALVAAVSTRAVSEAVVAAEEEAEEDPDSGTGSRKKLTDFGLGLRNATFSRSSSLLAAAAAAAVAVVPTFEDETAPPVLPELEPSLGFTAGSIASDEK